MYRLHLTRNLRSLAFLLVVAGIFGGLGLLWWANRTGLPDSWRAAIEHEISKNGPAVQLGSLRYIPFKGVVATDVQVFSPTEPRQEISRLERIVLDFDKTKLARGHVHLNKVELDDARLEMPVDPEDPDSEVLQISGANGTVFMPGDKRLEIRDAHGRIAGVEVVLDARIIGYRQIDAPPPDEDYLRKRRELAARIIAEIGKWQFDDRRPPRLKIRLDADTNDYSTLSAKISLEIDELERAGHRLEDVSASAEINGDLLTINSLHARDARGELDGRIDFDLSERTGRFDISSSLDIPQLLSAWVGLPPLPGVLIGGRQQLDAGGDFRLDEENTPHLNVTGHARGESVMLKGVPFDAVESAFAWNGESVFLRNIRLARGDGEARGKALIERPLVRMELRTSLPVAVYRPFFAGQVLGKVLDDFGEGKAPAIDVRLEGSFDMGNSAAWGFTGSGAIRNMTYKGVPVNAADCQFSLDHHELDFHHGTVNFDYTDYPLREAFGGPAEAVAKVGRIRYDHDDRLVHVEGVTGAIWAAPMVRLFAPKVADSLEQYRFHRPPELAAGGVVDTTPDGRTALDVTFRSDDAADYRFLGETLTLGSPSGKVAIRGGRVTVDDLSLAVFGGPVDARFTYVGNGRLEGELSWTRLSLPDLSSTYGFHMKGGGDVTGRIDFAMTGGDVRTMQGAGLLALEDAELFTVPMFGPLTPLIGGVLNDEHAGRQQARNAFCTFRIENGVLHTSDFQTATRSLDFAGDGWVDLGGQTFEMTLRMNARGLLKIITLPLRPFAGLFQFRGSGPLKEPKWESMKFTAPPGEVAEPPVAVPRAQAVESSR